MFHVDIKYITRFVCNKKNNSISTGVENLLMNSDLKIFTISSIFIWNIYEKRLTLHREIINP